jgi:hypothetical protein
MQSFRDLVPPSARLPNPDPFHRAQGQLNLGDILFSGTRAFQLIMQTDGNLVLYGIDDSSLPADITKGTYTGVIWASGTNGLGGNSCKMQDDGNLVIYDGSKAIWESATNGNSGAFLRCQDDGNLVVYANGGAALWASNTNAGSRGGESGGGVIPQGHGGGHGGGPGKK